MEFAICFFLSELYVCECNLVYLHDWTIYLSAMVFFLPLVGRGFGITIPFVFDDFLSFRTLLIVVRGVEGAGHPFGRVMIISAVFTLCVWLVV